MNGIKGMNRVLQVTGALHMGGAEHVAVCLAAMFATPGTPALLSVQPGPFERHLNRRHIGSHILMPTNRDGLYARQLARKLKSVARSAMNFGRAIAPPISATGVMPVQKDVLRHKCPDYAERFQAFLCQHHYDVAHIHSLTCAGMFRIAKAAGCGVVYGHHNILSERHGPEDIDFLNSELQWVDAVVCVSRASAVDFIATTGFAESKVHVISNPSLLATGEAQPLSSGLVAGTASNLQAAKGIDVLLDAWAELRRRGIVPRLVIAGGKSPDVIAYWKRYAKTLGIGGQVKFVGVLQSEKEMDAFYRSINLTVVPSVTEAFSLLAVESLSRGIPVVASDLPALREVLGDAGLLFPVGSHEELAGHLASLAAGEQQRKALGMKGLERWRAHYSTDIVERSYAALYGSVGQSLRTA